MQLSLQSYTYSSYSANSISFKVYAYLDYHNVFSSIGFVFSTFSLFFFSYSNNEITCFFYR